MSLCMGCMEEYEGQPDQCPHCGYDFGKESAHVLHMKPGTQLKKRYIVGKALGYGSFGVTYLGYDRVMRRKVAIKEYLPSEFATRTIAEPELIMPGDTRSIEKFEKGMKKFRGEAEKLAKVGKVDGVVYVYDTFEENRTAYIVMEYLQGETLGAYMARVGKIPETTALELIIPVLSALDTIHSQGIIHRDISPDNIFLSVDSAGKPQVKLIDFGAAKFASSSHSKSLTVLLRPGYSPEEQYRSSGEQSTYTDVYAVAAVLYQMVTGVRPPDALERRTSIERKKKDLLQLPSKLEPSLSDNFEMALLNALNVKIEDRTATADDFLAELISYEKVKRRGSSIRRIDFMRWPLWAKIGVPLAGAAALGLVVGIAFWLSNLTTASEMMSIPDGYTYVTSLVGMTEQAALESAQNSNLLITQTATRFTPMLDAGYVVTQDQDPFAIVPLNTTVGITISTSEEEFTLPDVVGLSEEAARTALDCMGLEISTIPAESDALLSGCVLEQDIKAFTTVKTGDKITLLIAQGDAPEKCTAPELVGLTYEEALQAAQTAGVKIVVVEKSFADDKADTEVLTQSVDAGSESTDALEITLSLKPRDFKLPNLLYKTQEEALQLLKNIGIDPEIVEESNEMLATGLVSGQSTDKGSTVRPGALLQLTVSSGSKPFAMPSVVGIPEAEAAAILQESTLMVDVEYSYDANVAVGSVISQSIPADTDVTRGTVVSIVVCSTENLVHLGSYVGSNGANAKEELQNAGFQVTITEIYSDTVAEGVVISQKPNADTYQQPGTDVVLTVSKGRELFAVPQVVGWSERDANAQLRNQGFGVSVGYEHNDKASGTVLRQNPSSGSFAAGTTVNLTVSSGPENTPKPTEPKTDETKPTEPQPTEGPWSDWTSSLPSGVTTSGYDIETKTEYRSREKETKQSSQSDLPGWTLVDSTYYWSDYSQWSSWSTDYVSSSDARDVQMKMQYSYRQKEYTTSSSSSLSGWTLYDSQVEYGSWSSWSDSYIAPSDGIEVETRTVDDGISRYFMAHYCTGNTGDPNTTYKTSNWKFSDLCSYHALGWFSNLNDFYQMSDDTHTYLYKSNSTSSCYRCSNTCYRWYIFDENYNYKTQYRYRTKSTTYYFWRWSEWSDYTDSYVQSSNTTEVRDRTLYRYRDRSKIYTYYYARWTDWTSWSSSYPNQTGNTEIQSRTVYRYRKKP